jgi:hypothetical protein
MQDIDIKGIDKARILAALYNSARVQGMGFLQEKPGVMPLSEAEDLVSKYTYFDYVHGRVMKVDLSGDTLNPRLYDRDNGPGAAARALREAGLTAS